MVMCHGLAEAHLKRNVSEFGVSLQHWAVVLLHKTTAHKFLRGFFHWKELTEVNENTSGEYINLITFFKVLYEDILLWKEQKDFLQIYHLFFHSLKKKIEPYQL